MVFHILRQLLRSPIYLENYSDENYRIEKSHGSDGTRTHVRKLGDDERREEIARMLSGASVTDEARAQASRLLDAA